ncbi:fasciclin-like arabinogalactan protein 9 [Silene latifolia]|uniref:fasciclin-like arabinogalactan protein 9 n=1 Tax=Silene latifolia TaxID=37657 RepID=UPI003D784DD5
MSKWIIHYLCQLIPPSHFHIYINITLPLHSTSHIPNSKHNKTSFKPVKMKNLQLTVLIITTLAVACAGQKPAPGPAPAGPVNLTGILAKGGQFGTFIRLLTSTQVAEQVNSQVNHSTQGMTVFAPTDNAFQNLKPGLINGLTAQEQVELILSHVLPQYYTFDTFQTASNPVRTQATVEDGRQIGLTVTYLGVNSVNVSSGMVTTQVNTVVSDKFPLAVFQVDKVLLPKELFGAKPPKSSAVKAPPPAKTVSDGGEDKVPAVVSADKAKNGAYGLRSVGLGLWGGVVGLVTMVVFL